ncbi:MAG: InlB B-repeat-containing protein [Candidatus Bathyarchaeota archaeon]|nr:InlB B-repeat-containing protein [Candidatus Termiticorpusculum sp.]
MDSLKTVITKHHQSVCTKRVYSKTHFSAKTFKQTFSLKTLFTITLILALLSTPLLTCAIENVGVIPLPSDVKVNYGEVTLTKPTNLKTGEVYVSKGVTYVGDGVFDVTLYVTLSDCYVFDENIDDFTPDWMPTLETGSSVIFVYTFGSQFSLKDAPSSALFDVTPDGITWTIPESYIQAPASSAQVSFTVELNEGWNIDTPYYTDDGVCATFTPAVGNRHYYGMMKEVVPAAFTVSKFNWNNSEQGFTNLVIIDTTLDEHGVVIMFDPKVGDIVVDGVTYHYLGDSKTPEAAPDDYYWGSYKMYEPNKAYHFWVKPSSTDNIFGKDINYLFYPISVPQNGGHASLVPSDKTIFYNTGQKDAKFTWNGTEVITNLSDQGYIELMDESAYRINYDLSGGVNNVVNPRSYYPTKLPVTIKDPSWSGYKFLGWIVIYANGTIDYPQSGDYLINGRTMGDIYFIALWEPSYNINYVLGYNDELYISNNPQVYSNSNSFPISIGNPVRSGYEFLGWVVFYANNTWANENPSYKIPAGTTGDITLMANWRNTDNTGSYYNIEYNLGSGVLDPGNPLSYIVVNGIPLTLDENPLTIYNPERVDYDFLGWIVENANGDVLGWIDVVSGWISNPESVSGNMVAVSEEVGIGFTIKSGVMGDLVLTALWTVSGGVVGDDGETVYAVTYMLGSDGQNHEDNPALFIVKNGVPYAVTIVDGDVQTGNALTMIYSPVRVGYLFLGWTVTGIVPFGDVSVDLGTYDPDDDSIVDVFICDLILTAKWIPIYSIKYFSSSGSELSANGNPEFYIVDDTGVLYEVTVNGYGVAVVADEVGLTILDPEWDVDHVFLGWSVFYTSGTYPVCFVPPYSGSGPSDIENVEGDLFLIANWGREDVYTITYYNVDYEAYDFVSTTGAPVLYVSGDLPLKIPNPSRNGSLFLGWTVVYVGNNEFNNVYHDAIENGAYGVLKEYTIPNGATGNIILVAHWEPSYKIEYRLGSPNADNDFRNPLWYSESCLQLMIYEPSLKDSVFLGWTVQYANGNVETLYTEDTVHYKVDDVSVTANVIYIKAGTTGDLVLTANWDQSYSIKYHLNGGAFDEAGDYPISYNPDGLPLTISNPVLTPEMEAAGLNFWGWRVMYVADGSRVICEGIPHETVTDLFSDVELLEGTVGDILLMAVWKPSFDILYNLGVGGINHAKNPDLYWDDLLPLNIYVPTMHGGGAIFVGWSVTIADGQPFFVEFDASTAISDDYGLISYVIPTGTEGEIRLTAAWYSTYTITYTLNGGNHPMTPSTYNTLNLPLPITNPTKAHYIFEGWTLVYANHTILSVEPNFIIPLGTTGDLTLIANWKPTPYNINYVMNGGNNPADNPKSYTVEDLIFSSQINIKDPTLADSTFLGWSIKYENGTSVTMPLVLSYKILPNTSGDIILTAHWLNNTDVGTKYCTITYDGNGNDFGSTPVDSQQYVSGSTVIVLSQGNMSRKGYTFRGWATSNTTTVVTHMPSSTFVITQEKMQLFAVWEEISELYTVIYTSGTHGTFEDQVTDGLFFGVPTPTAPKVNDDGEWVFNGWSPKPTETVTDNAIYEAQWALKKYTVTFIDPDGNVIAEVEVESGKTVTPPTPPTRNGYTFKNWSKPLSNIVSDQVIEAQYEQNPPVDESTPSDNNSGNSSGSSSNDKSSTTKSPTKDTPNNTPSDQTPSNSEPVIEPNTPNSGGYPVWALVNLVLSVVGLILVAILVICVLLQRKQNQEQQQIEQKDSKSQQNSTKHNTEQDNDDVDKTVKKQKQRRMLWFLLSIIMSIAGIIVFILTEDMSRPMVLFDKWTIVNAIIFIVETIAIALTFKHKKNTDDKDDITNTFQTTKTNTSNNKQTKHLLFKKNILAVLIQKT